VAHAGTSSALAMMHARRPGVRAEDGDGLARLHDERFVVLERRSVATIASKAAQLRAARPEPP
jgi:hypothetical protein